VERARGGAGHGLGALAEIRRENLAPALPFLVAWLAAPAVAWWISRPIELPEPDLSEDQQAFLGRSARRTWHFFETFVTAQENWLPPDNFQEVPGPTIASRTSPTNIGLALLANLAARDFGYLAVGGLVQRTQDTLATLHRLERQRGHFFNWYDTRTLQPLPPLYLSTVDSGNLAGHLLTLGAGLRELGGERIFGPHVGRGLRDTVGVLRSEAGESAALAQIEATLAVTPTTLSGALEFLDTVHAQASRFLANLHDDAGEARRWAVALERTCASHRDDLRQLAPWLTGSPGSAAWTRRTGLARLEAIPTLQALAELDALPGSSAAPWRASAGVARERLVALEALARQCEEFANMDFRFLFDPARELFAIGYNVTDRRRDPGYYDLLASESRLGSYVAIAQGQVPQDHWFSLGRLLVAVQGEPILLSWSGSMFEYLMPMLVMPNYPTTLLAHTCEAAVRQQIKYGEACGIPWGISESGYNRTDAHLNYQYRAFGVPGLGLKRGLADDRVIAPYATVLALMVAPRAACENLERLAADGREGSCGFYEAVDYTPARQRPNESSALLRSFMAHHQGMSLLAFLYVLRDRPMQRRFLACPVLRAADLLLQERVPRATASVFAGDLELVENGKGSANDRDGMRVFSQPGARIPDVHLLSNGRYHLVITSAGGGYSHWHDLALTRWREDATRDCWGTFVYLRDLGDGRVLVHDAPTRPSADERRRSHLHGGARGVPPASRRTRGPHRDLRFPGGRHRVATDQADQSLPVATR
jgi:cyclic beta-1,2-glucan synthetase